MRSYSEKLNNKNKKYMKKNSKSTKQYRQGDVLVIKTDKIPSGLKPTKKVTLALGEVTGHHHSITDDGAVGFADNENSLAKFVEAKESVTLTHQEHEAINLPAGTYKSVRQTEFTPEELKNVAD